MKEWWMWSLAAVLASATWVSAGGRHGGCDKCGCQAPVEKVCRVICETKEVKETKYSAECEDFCVPSPSVKCGCSWMPGCGELFTRKKLVKTEVTKKVPSYKWEVVTVCKSCCPPDAVPLDQMPSPLPPATAPTPAPPAPAKQVGLRLPR